MHVILLLVLALASATHAQAISHYDDWQKHSQDYSCAFACQTALNKIGFGNSSPEDERTSLCSSQLRTESIYRCMDLYCPQEIEAGEQYISTWCEIYGFVSLAPYAKFNHSISREQILRDAVADQNIYDNLLASGDFTQKIIVPYPAMYQITFKTIATFYWEQDIATTYGYAMYGFWACVIAISLSFKTLGYFCNSTSKSKEKDAEQRSQTHSDTFLEKFRRIVNSHIGLPATLGKHAFEPYGWCTVPPLVETLTIFIFLVVNIALIAAKYETFDGNVYYPTKAAQLSRYLSDRLGIIAFANLPLLWLFAQRNSLIVWLVGWSPRTVNIFHRWVARITTVESIVHGIVRSVWVWQVGGYESWISHWEEQWWKLGIVAVVIISLMLGTSVYGLRAKAYDVFLYLHITMAFVFLVAIFYHAKVYLSHQYDGYLWACAAIWILDRVMRTCRIVLINCLRARSATACYSPSSKLVCVEVPVSPLVARLNSSFFYVYVLHGSTFFQSHPFTASYAISSSGRNIVSSHHERHGAIETERQMSNNSSVKDEGATSSENFIIDQSTLRFFIRPHAGFTRNLREQLTKRQGSGAMPLRVIVEGPYRSQRSVHHYDNVLWVVGGSGVTVALQYLQALVQRQRSGKAIPNLHVLWAIRQLSLFDDFKDELEAYRSILNIRLTLHSTSNQDLNADEVKTAGFGAAIHGRPEISKYVETERTDLPGSLAVVSCTPPAMADDTRQAVVRVMRSSQRNIELVEETFSW